MPQPRSQPNFYEVQKRQWRISLLFTSLLFAAYFLVFAFLALIVLAVLDVLLGRFPGLTWPWLARAMLGACALALVVSVFQYLSARRSGAAFILRRLVAQEPNPSDRYHARFLNIVEEMRIASGLPRTKAYILPFMAVNCLALVEADGTPAVVATEGLVAESTRQELQAAAAHELAHILKGDVFYITLLCSLADFFERLAEKMSPEDGQPEIPLIQPSAGAGVLAAQGAGAVAMSLSGAALRLLSLLVSREREIMADAAAVELCRDPAGLARVLYKAGLKNSFIGDFRLTYSPLFMVSSDPAAESEGWAAGLFNTHPPLEKRIALLAAQAGLSTDEVAEQVWNSQEARDQAKRLKLSAEELNRLRPPESDRAEGAASPAVNEDPQWRLRDGSGAWRGPLTLKKLVSHPMFSPFNLVHNDQEGVTARAREFQAVRRAAQALSGGRLHASAPGGTENCPLCREALVSDHYEGVPVKFCRRCRGRLVPASGMERILARREYVFSEGLIKRAADFKKKALRNPWVADQKKGLKPVASLVCPHCGARMHPRPYNYQYFISVDKCLSCFQIWFDADELEILQVLVERP